MIELRIVFDGETGKIDTFSVQGPRGEAAPSIEALCFVLLDSAKSLLVDAERARLEQRLIKPATIFGPHFGKPI